MAQVRDLIVMRENGSANGAPRQDPARVLAEITGIGTDYFGFAEVIEIIRSSGDCTPEEGQGVFLLRPVIQYLAGDRENDWKKGDQVVLEVILNSNEKHQDTTPLAGVKVFPQDRRSTCLEVTAEDMGESSATRSFETLKEKVGVIVASWQEVDEERADSKARKAAEDLKVAIANGNLPSANSCLGRLESRVAKMVAATALPNILRKRAGEIAEILGI